MITLALLWWGRLTCRLLFIIEYDKCGRATEVSQPYALSYMCRDCSYIPFTVNAAQ